MRTKTTNHITLTNLTNYFRRIGSRLWLCLVFVYSSGVLGQTISWQENWESPAAPDCWAADLGYWQIGVPTSGPGRAHQGTNVAATVLNGNYTDDRQSRLSICTNILVPRADQHPRLRFWHWWSFNLDDYGQVQISTNNGGSWIGLSPRYGEGSPANYDSSGRWTRACLDLTPYAGQMVRLGLYFFSRNDSPGTSVDVAPGWYVDEMVVESGPLAEFIPLDSFEDPAAQDRWCADFGVWEIGAPTSGPGRAHSGSNCLATILSGNYTDDRRSFITSRPFVLPPPDQSPRLRFWHWWSCNLDDYGQMYISTNSGANWIVLSPRYGEGSPANYDSSRQWTRACLDLTPYAGQMVRLGLYFFSRNDSPGTSVDVASGWYVDELVIESGALADFIPLDSFEDPAAQNRWCADFGVWEIGVPTSGPPLINGKRAHSGTNCLATILSGNYTDDRRSFIIGQPFVVPPSETNPRLRFWHWWNFNLDDYGEAWLNYGTNWVRLGSRYTTSSGEWTQTPLFSLVPYAGQTCRLGFYFFSQNDSPGTSTDVAPGWYIDDVRLLHDPALLLVGSPVVRTQSTACVSLGIALDSPSSGASFVIEAPAGNLSNPLLSTEGCWSGTLTTQSSTQWLVNLQSSCTAGSAGVEAIGTVCFTAISQRSAFVPLTVKSLVVSNHVTPAHAYGSRAVNIANEPLLEASRGPNQQRMLTTYGKPNTDYEIQYANRLVCAESPMSGACEVDASGWPVGWTNTVPASLSYTEPLRGAFSNAPTLFLRAKER